MKRIITTLIAVAITTFSATGASAHIAKVTASIPVATATNQADLEVAIASAVDDALRRTIGFTPTVVTLQEIHRIGDHIYLHLLIVDAAGEAVIQQLATDAAKEAGEPSTEGAADDGQML